MALTGADDRAREEAARRGGERALDRAHRFHGDEAAERASGPSGEVAAMLADLPARDFPRTVQVAGQLGAYGSDQHYEFVLAAFVDGLPPPSPSRTDRGRTP